MAGTPHQLHPGSQLYGEGESGEVGEDQDENETITRSHSSTDCIQGNPTQLRNINKF